MEEHYASGVVSHTAYNIQARIGGEQGWRAVEALFYATINNGQLGDLSFSDFATALRTNASYTPYGDIVDEELTAAGL
jgi:hypothetical protein